MEKNSEVLLPLKSHQKMLKSADNERYCPYCGEELLCKSCGKKID